jgi:hypothetical protein
MVNDLEISDKDVARSRADPRFKQVLLAKMLEQLLGKLYRLQHGAADAPAPNIGELQEGATMAVRLADLIRTIDDRIRLSARR